MTEFLLKIADVIVQVKTKTDRPWKRCRKYLVEEGVPEITVEITDEDLERDEEFLAVQRKITEKLIDFDVLLFHSSLMAVDGFGYAYSAPSGTGKSTHTAILRKVYGDRVQIVNDDKPFLRLKDGVVYAYGTPWAGKEHLENNIKVPLHASQIHLLSS